MTARRLTGEQLDQIRTAAAEWTGRAAQATPESTVWADGTARALIALQPNRLLAEIDRLAAEVAQLRQGIRQLARATGQPLAAHCGTCGARPGRPCTSILPGGQLTGPHTARIWTARKASR